jgi:hypothetical protein
MQQSQSSAEKTRRCRRNYDTRKLSPINALTKKCEEWKVAVDKQSKVTQSVKLLFFKEIIH